MENKIDRLAKILWDYHHLNHSLEKSDLILVFGSRDSLPAIYGCELFLKGYAPYILFSGNHGRKQVLEKPEAEVYRDIAIQKGIPADKIFIENTSCNTGENTLFSKELILKERLPHSKIILIQKPYMERRTFATFKKIWNEPEIIVSSPQMSFEEYTVNNPYDEKERIIQRMVGDTQRMKEYPKLGFQIEQDIPEDVWQAYEKLVALGYTEYLIKN